MSGSISAGPCARHGQNRARSLSTGHFDAAIQHYREFMEPFSELPESVKGPIARAAACLPEGVKPQPAVHVLDLSPQGAILPHVDSVKFFGDHIIGISCLSDGIMKFQQAPEEYLSAEQHAAVQRSIAAGDSGHRESLQVWLPRRSLYVMSGECRRLWTHAVLQGSVPHRTTLSPSDWAAGKCAVGAKASASPYRHAQPDANGVWTVDIHRSRRMSLLVRDELPARGGGGQEDPPVTP